MRIAIVCPYDWSFPGGVKSHVHGLSKALVGRGHQVEVMAPSTEGHHEIFRAGRSFAVPVNGSVARICFSPKARRRVVDRMNEERFDVVHLHEPAIPSISLLALTQSRVPAVGTFHASAERSIGYQVAAPILRPLIARLRSRIVVSSAAQRLVGRYFPGDYRTIPNGIEYARFASAAPDPDLERLAPYVLFVGRPEPRKGFEIAVQALERVRETLAVNFVVAGRGSEEVPSWAVGLGPVEHERLPGVYSGAAAYLAPSLGGESFGIVIAEAMAAGTPVVCSDLPGYLEAAAGASLTFPKGRADQAAERLISVLRDDTLRQDLIQRGSRRAHSLDWDVLVEDVLDTYRAAVS